MTTSVPRLPPRFAETVGAASLDFQHRVRYARIDGEFRGVQGRTDVAADEDDVGRMTLIGLTGHLPQRLTGQVVRRLRVLPALQPVYYVARRGENHEIRYVMAEPGTPLLDYVKRHINALRHGATYSHALQFKTLTVVYSGDEVWVEVTTSHLHDARVSRPIPNLGADGLPYLCVFGHRPARRPTRASELPRWGNWSGITHAVSIDVGTLTKVARLLGPLDQAPEYPIEERFEFQPQPERKSGPPAEADDPLPVNHLARPRANADEVSTEHAKNTSRETHGQGGSPSSGLDHAEDEPLWTNEPPPRRRRTG